MAYVYLLTFGIRNITRAHVVPNLGHKIFMFQKFGIANKNSILERLSSEKRKWALAKSAYEHHHFSGSSML